MRFLENFRSDVLEDFGEDFGMSPAVKRRNERWHVAVRVRLSLE